jgi:hypothetical protein
MPRVKAPFGLQTEVYTFRDAMVILGASADFLKGEVDAGRLRSFKRGKFRMISRAAIQDYIALLESEERKGAA